LRFTGDSLGASCSIAAGRRVVALLGGVFGGQMAGWIENNKQSSFLDGEGAKKQGFCFLKTTYEIYRGI